MPLFAAPLASLVEAWAEPVLKLEGFAAASLGVLAAASSEGLAAASSDEELAAASFVVVAVASSVVPAVPSLVVAVAVRHLAPPVVACREQLDAVAAIAAVAAALPLLFAVPCLRIR